MTRSLHRLACAVFVMSIGVALTAASHAQQKQKQKEAWEYLKEPAFKSAYMKALGPKANTPWIAKRDGPAPLDTFVTVGGQRYVKNAFCKNQDCNNNSAVILYSPEKKVVYGTIYEKGKTTVIGDPPAPVAAELATLWKREWRSTPQ
jgi:hypothetical protein